MFSETRVITYVFPLKVHYVASIFIEMFAVGSKYHTFSNRVRISADYGHPRLILGPIESTYVISILHRF